MLVLSRESWAHGCGEELRGVELCCCWKKRWAASIEKWEIRRSASAAAVGDGLTAGGEIEPEIREEARCW